MNEKKIKIPPQIGPYLIKESIGSGSFATVHMCIDTRNSTKYAMKIVHRSSFSKDQVLEHFEMEIRVLHQMRHQNIVQFIDMLKDDNFIFVILELCPNGDLFNFIVDHKFLSENETRVIFKQIISGLCYIHSIGAMHRDLKPENILLDSTGMAKLSDFGFARYAPNNNLVKTPCGTTSYASPECIAGKPYDGAKSDMWSIGVILFAMVTGQLPWTEKNHAQLHQQIMRGEYKVPEYLSSQMKELISSLMNLDPDKRPTCKEILSHPWLDGADTLELPYVQPIGVTLKYLDRFFNVEVSEPQIKEKPTKTVSAINVSYDEIKSLFEFSHLSENINSNQINGRYLTSLNTKVFVPSAADIVKRKQLFLDKSSVQSSFKQTPNRRNSGVSSTLAKHNVITSVTKQPQIKKPILPKLNR